MGFSLPSLCRDFCLLSAISLLLTGPAFAQFGPTPPIPLPSGPGSKPPVPLPSGPGTKPPIAIPGFSPLPPQPTTPIKPSKPPYPPVLLCPAPNMPGSIEYANQLFQGAATFRFRWTEQRDPRDFGNAEYRRLTCDGEAQRYGDSLRLRFKVTMVTDTDTQYSEWIVMGGAEGGQRFHRKTTEGPWNEITNATPWLTELTKSLRLFALWQPNDMYPTLLTSTQNGSGRWNTYHFTSNKTRDAYYFSVDSFLGQIIQVTHRSTAETLPYTFNRTIDYWGYNLFTEITAPQPGETGPLPVPATYSLIDRR